MTTNEKMELIERVLRLEPNTLTETTKLNTLQEWDSLNILTLQVEFTAIQPDMQFDTLYTCNTVGEVCMLI